MTSLEIVPIAASQIKTHGGKLKFSTLLESFRLLPTDHLADIFHGEAIRLHTALSQMM